jgi:CheY-like chemotaxis protein
MQMTPKIHVLIVDDNRETVKLYSALLNLEGFQVTPAYDGYQALEKIKQETIDVVLLDIMMPEIDGIEICRQLKSSPETEEITIVMVTALSDQENKVKAQKAGANGYLTKPVRVDELIGAIMTTDNQRD